MQKKTKRIKNIKKKLIEVKEILQNYFLANATSEKSVNSQEIIPVIRRREQQLNTAEL